MPREVQLSEDELIECYPQLMSSNDDKDIDTVT